MARVTLQFFWNGFQNSFISIDWTDVTKGIRFDIYMANMQCPAVRIHLEVSIFPPQKWDWEYLLLNETCVPKHDIIFISNHKIQIKTGSSYLLGKLAQKSCSSIDYSTIWRTLECTNHSRSSTTLIPLKIAHLENSLTFFYVLLIKLQDNSTYHLCIE